MAKKPSSTFPFEVISRVPNLCVLYDYGRWHVGTSRNEEHRIVHVTEQHRFSVPGREPWMVGYSKTESERRGLTTWGEHLWSRSLRFIFPSVPSYPGTSSLNSWGGTEFVPYAEAVLANDLGLVESIDSEPSSTPGVRSVVLKCGIVMYVKRSTPLGSARLPDGSWLVWTGDGSGWVPSDCWDNDRWNQTEAVSFGTPVVELHEVLSL